MTRWKGSADKNAVRQAEHEINLYTNEAVLKNCAAILLVSSFSRIQLLSRPGQFKEKSKGKCIL